MCKGVARVACGHQAEAACIPWIAFGFENQGHQLVCLLSGAWCLIVPLGHCVQIVVVEPARAFVWSARGPVRHETARHRYASSHVSIGPRAVKRLYHDVTTKQLAHLTVFQLDVHVFY